MSSKIWRKDPSITEELIAEPYLFTFFQAVRLLERASVFDDKKISNQPLAGFTPPNTEALRIHSHQSFIYHSAEISAIETTNSSTDLIQWQMFINFMGLSGSSGVLPYHYTELILQRLKVKDQSLIKFLDLFNHRTVSLFYQSNIKYRLPLAYEKNKLFSSSKPDTDSHSKVLLSLMGLGTGKLNNRLFTKDESLIFYSGLFNQSVRTVSGLQQILQHHFDVPVEIKEFVGQWENVLEDALSRLPSKAHPKGCNGQLGISTMLGSKAWFAQYKIHIILKPENKQQFNKFSPGTNTLAALNELVRLYVGLEFDYDFIVRMKKSSLPDAPSMNNHTPLILGWNTWLPERTKNQPGRDDDVDICISSTKTK